MRISDIGPQRLASQRITGETFATPADAVRWLGAMQAQDYHQAVWAVGLRVQGATLETVEAAIADGSILRTWPMRGTIHFVAPEDAQWMVQLCAKKLLKADDRRLQQLELTRDDMAHCADIFREALSGGKRLSRPDMLALLEGHGISMAGQRGYHTLWFTAQSGVICMGPMDGKQQTFALLDEWAPNPRQLEHDAALNALIHRYFISHGPATIDDFARWSGLTKTATKNSLHDDSSGLMSEEIGGVTYWLAADVTPTHPADHVQLLPGFDEFVLGYKNRDAVLHPDHARKICPGNNGVFYPTVVLDGQIVGVWKRKIKRKQVDLTFDYFWPLHDDVHLVTEQATRYGTFLGLPAHI